MLEMQVDGFVKYLEEYAKNARLVLTQMTLDIVRLWASDAVKGEGAFTPVGDYDLYSEYYDARPSYMTKLPGLARGGWSFSTIMEMTQNLKYRDPEGTKIENKLSTLEERFTLGTPILIYNIIPYINNIGVRGTKGQQTVNVYAPAYQSLLTNAEDKVIQTFKITASAT